jgi:hypothetical protein
VTLPTRQWHIPKTLRLLDFSDFSDNIRFVHDTHEPYDTGMIYSAIHPCPTPKCGALHTVFVQFPDDPRSLVQTPPAETRFEYTCPKCNKRIQFTYTSGSKVDAIPKGAVVARPV